MSTSKENGGWDARKMSRVRYRVAMVRHLIDLEGEWTSVDVTGVEDHKRLDGALRVLRQIGAVDVVKKLWPKDRNDVGSYRVVYRWNPDAKTYIEEYLENLDTFPCGHRAHVYNPASTPEGVFECKECGAEFERATVEALL